MEPDPSKHADIADLYSPFREQIASLATDDALYTIWAHAQHLQLSEFQFPNDIEVARPFIEHPVPRTWIAEWELLLIAKEVIVNCNDEGLSLRNWAVLSSIMNALKALEDGIYRRYGSSGNVLIEMNRIAHRQFVWQGDPPDTSAFARYLAIFDTPEIDLICRERVGLPVRAVLLYGLMLFGGFMEGAVVGFPQEGSGIDKKDFEAFLKFSARSKSELAEMLSSEQAFDSRFVYTYNSLHAYPLVISTRGDTDALVCPLPTLLFWRVTKGLYYSLVDDARFGQHLGTSFQKYVGECITRAVEPKKAQLLHECRYGAKAIAKDSVDWIVLNDSCAIFIECKAKRISWTAKQSLEDLTPLLADVGYLASAVVQTYRNFVDYRDNKYPHLPFDKHRDVLLLIVTLENWFIFGPKIKDFLRAAIVEKITQAGLPEAILDQVPFSVISVSELESAMQVSNEIGLEEFWWGKMTHPEMFEWNWQSYVFSQFPKFEVKNLFEPELEELSPDQTIAGQP